MKSCFYETKFEFLKMCFQTPKISNQIDPNCVKFNLRSFEFNTKSLYDITLNIDTYNHMSNYIY